MMTMMKNPIILATCLLIFSSLTVLASDNSFGPDQCCFKFWPKTMKPSNVVSFKRMDALCPMQSVLLKTRKGAEICADPNKEWVKTIIEAKEKARTKALKSTTPSE